MNYDGSEINLRVFSRRSEIGDILKAVITGVLLIFLNFGNIIREKCMASIFGEQLVQFA